MYYILYIYTWILICRSILGIGYFLLNLGKDFEVNITINNDTSAIS